MTLHTGLAAIVGDRRRIAGAIGIALILPGMGLTGCGVVRAVKKITHDMAANRATIDAFTGKLKSGEATTFEATYVTTGSSPARIVYAVRPPKGLAFTDSPSAGGSSGTGTAADIVVNSSGAYSCSAPSAGSGWSCEKLGTAAAVKNKVLGFYTPAHWVAFLRDFALAAGFAGDSVTTSSMTVHGFSMQCVDFRAPGVQGTSTICTTAQGILGYVKVASNPTSFEITAYSTSPPAALFKLPHGAKVTTPKTGTK
jgi:hypothetical protein